eukprot:4056616-Amphidinium_carterae.1
MYSNETTYFELSLKGEPILRQTITQRTWNHLGASSFSAGISVLDNMKTLQLNQLNGLEPNPMLCELHAPQRHPLKAASPEDSFSSFHCCRRWSLPPIDIRTSSKLHMLANATPLETSICWKSQLSSSLFRPQPV